MFVLVERLSYQQRVEKPTHGRVQDLREQALRMLQSPMQFQQIQVFIV